MNRILCLTLCGALVAGIWPDPAAAAAIVAPAASGSAVTRVVVPALSFTGAGLSGAAPTLSAPSLTAPGLITAAPQALRLQAPPAAAQAAPAAAVETAAAPAAMAAAAVSAAAQPSRTIPQAASAETPIPSLGTQGETRPAAQPLARTLKNVREFGTETAAVPFSRMAAGESAMTAGRLFDNGALRSGSANGVRLPAALTTPFSLSARLVRTAVARSPLGRLLPAATALRWGRAPPPAPVKTEFSRDDFGGPQALPGRTEGGRLRRAFSRLGRDLRYGLKWGVTLFGLSSIIDVTIRPLAAAIPWVSWIPHGLLGAFGRVELLTSMGPGAIAEAVADSPVTFFGLTLPYAAAAEEVSFRLLKFGVDFLFLAAIRPAATRLANFLEDVPDLFGLRSSIQWGLRKVAGISSHAFGIASLLSTVSFATAHFAAWGVAPATLALHLSLGLALAWVAYRSRGLVAPMAAHFSFNALSIALGVLLPLYLMPQTAAVAATLAGVLSVSFLYYQWRSWRSDKAAAEAAARGLAMPAAPSLWKRARRWLTLALVPVVMLAALSYSSGPQMPAAAPALPPAAAAAPATPAAPAHAAVVRPTLSVEDLVKSVKPAVVMVRTPTGSGSGFIISPDGLLVTNGHVVAGHESSDPLYTGHAPFVKIRFANGREVPAKVVGFNAAKDLALIQLPPNPFGWPFVPLGDSKSVPEGREVVAMGYPRALPFTATRGIISGTQFRSNGWVTYFQHDAAVNPGNSGGPLFNLQGEVIGVNSMIMSQSGGFEGISYAITAADVQGALDQYARVGNISPAWLGVILQKAGADAPFGLRVDAVRPGSPAQAAGLRPGDVLIGIEGHSVAGEPTDAFKALFLTLRAKAPGDALHLQAYRDGAVVDVPVTLAAP